MTPKDVKALQPISVSSYQCPVCKHLYVTLESAATCTGRCGAEAYRKDLYRRKEEKRIKNMNWVRENATSLEHAIQLMKEYTKTLGLKLTIGDYPRYFGHVSNTHEAPIGFPTNIGWHRESNGLPLTYLGWSGRWVGSLRGKCPMQGCWHKNEPDMGCLFEHIVSGFHSGTGCPGKDFSISGTIFLQDFPKMITTGGLVNLFLKEGHSNLSAIEAGYTLAPLFVEAAKHPLKAKKLLDFEVNKYNVVVGRKQP